jgi:hypothetical protein
MEETERHGGPSVLILLQSPGKREAHSKIWLVIY